MNRRLHLVAAVAVLSCLVGCHAAPRTEGEPEVYHPTEWDRITSPGTYWIRHDLPVLRRMGVRKIVIAEFAVEFVKERYYNSYEKIGTLRVDLTEVSPLGAGKKVIGLGKRVADYEPALYSEVPKILYREFRRALELQGIEIPTDDEVKQTGAYSRYTTVPSTNSSLLSRLGIAGTDTGRIKSTATYPTPSLALIQGAKDGDVEIVDQALAEELGADLVVRARFRIGVYEGKASIESGSTIAVTGPRVLGSFASVRSLLSSQSVLNGDKFKPVRGKVYEVNTPKYQLALESLFNTYLDLVFDAPRVK